MIQKLGQRFTDLFIRIMPSSYVFALLLTLIAVILAMIFTKAGIMDVIKGWYGGFWSLLAFGMQIVLIIITAYSIAQAPIVRRGLDLVSKFIRTPGQVYFWVVLTGALLSLISFGMIVVIAILARELATRIKGINYPFLIACVYFSMNGWVSGLSSSIALLLNTENNFLIEAGILETVIPTGYTLGSPLNLAMLSIFIIGGPLLFLLIAPRTDTGRDLSSLLSKNEDGVEPSIKEEADSYRLPFKAASDMLNNATWLQWTVAAMGMIYIVYHFATRGFDLNFNIMIFLFIILGLFFHRTPLRYTISMQRASRNISGVLFQYPFYAGIMGIMLSTGLGEQIGGYLASVATVDSYPFFAYLSGGVVNFAIPSAGGEFAVIGPSIIEVVKELGTGLPQEQLNAMIARASMSVAYGESLSNLLQPFFLLIVFPVMGAGVKLQARDIVGYLVIPFMVYFCLQSALVVWMPM